MSRRVALPPGCTGLDLQDGTRYTADRRGLVEVADRHADAIKTGWYGQSGVIDAGIRHTVGTRTGRWCRVCSPARLWNLWNKNCPRCGAETSEESS